MQNISGKRIAVLATDGFEQVELTEPVEAIRKAGGIAEIISLESDDIQGMNHDEKGDTFSVDHVVSEVKADDFDALVLPGGVQNPDSLRMDADAVQFIRDFFTQHKPVAAICHGPWLLVEANVVKDRELTSFPSIKTDILNAGGRWVDEEVVNDAGMITSRNPDDIPAFCEALLDAVQEGTFARQSA